MLITPSVNYRDLLRRVLSYEYDIDWLLVKDSFTQEEKNILEDLHDSNVQDT